MGLFSTSFLPSPQPLFSPCIFPPDLLRHDACGAHMRAAEPDAGDLAALVADAAHRLAVAGIARGGDDYAGVAAGDLDLAGIHEGVVELRIGDQHAVAHRHEI